MVEHNHTYSIADVLDPTLPGDVNELTNVQLHQAVLALREFLILHVDLSHLRALLDGANLPCDDDVPAAAPYSTRPCGSCPTCRLREYRDLLNHEDREDPE